MVLFFLALIIMITITLRASTSTYYFKYYVGRPELIAAFVPAYMVAAAAGASLTPVMTRFIDKKTAPDGSHEPHRGAIRGFLLRPQGPDRPDVCPADPHRPGPRPQSPLAFAMYADTADYNEWRTGRRATALTFAAATFSQKLGTALAAVVMASVFTALGYVADTAQTPNPKPASS